MDEFAPVTEWLYQTFAAAGSPGALWIQWSALAALVVAFGFGVRGLLELAPLVRRERSFALCVAGLIGLAWLLRWYAPHAQADLYFRLKVALQPVELSDSMYGLALPSMLRAFFDLGFGEPEWVVLQLTLGALTLLPLVVVARRLGLDALQAFVAAAILALHPLHVRFSASDWAGIPETFFMLFGLALLLDPARRRSTALGAGWLVGMAASMRPEAGFAVLAAAGLAATARVGWSRTAWGALGMAITYAGQALATLAAALERPERVPRWKLPEWGDLLALDWHWTPLPVALALLAVLFVRPPALRLRVWLLVTLALASWWVPDGTVSLLLAGARHQVRMLPFLALAAAIPLGALLRVAPPLPRAALAAALVALCVMPLPNAYWKASLHHELEFAREVLPTLPAGCEILTYQSHGKDLALRPPHHLAPQLHWTLATSAPLAVPDAECVLYYRGANCYAKYRSEVLPQAAASGALPLGPRCGGWEAQHRLEPVAERTIAARRFSTDHYPSRSTLQIGVYSVDGRDPGPRAAWPAGVEGSREPPIWRQAEERVPARALPAARPVAQPGLREAAERAGSAAECGVAPELSCDDVACLVVLVGARCSAKDVSAELTGELGDASFGLSFSRSLDSGATIVLVAVPEARRGDRALLERLSLQAQARLGER